MSNVTSKGSAQSIKVSGELLAEDLKVLVAAMEASPDGKLSGNKEEDRKLALACDRIGYLSHALTQFAQRVLGGYAIAHNISQEEFAALNDEMNKQDTELAERLQAIAEERAN